MEVILKRLKSLSRVRNDLRWALESLVSQIPQGLEPPLAIVA
jgi:hypothetical protein